MVYTVQRLLPAESHSVHAFYRAQNYKVSNTHKNHERSTCFALCDTDAAAAVDVKISTATARTTMATAGAEDVSTAAAATVGNDWIAPHFPPEWAGCVRVVKSPRQGKRGSPVIHIVRELCVALHARRRGLGKSIHTSYCVHIIHTLRGRRAFHLGLPLKGVQCEMPSSCMLA